MYVTAPVTAEVEIGDRELEAFRRFLEYLPHGRDRELVILKAHLLVEEQLRQLIDERVSNPSVLPKLGFAQCLSLARSFFPPEHDPSLWESLELLNQLRNGLAHQLSAPHMEQRIAALVRNMQPERPLSVDAAVNFEFALWTLFTGLAHLVEKPSASVLKLVPPSAG